jgi:hypothetical protein
MLPTPPRKSARAPEVFLCLERPEPAQRLGLLPGRHLPVGEPSELLRDLFVGHRIARVASRKLDLPGHDLPRLRSHLDPVGGGGRIALAQLGILSHLDAGDEVEKSRIRDPLLGELREPDLAILECHGNAVGQAVVGGLAGPGAPLLGIGDDLDRGVEGLDPHALDGAGVADLLADPKRGIDGALRVVLGRPVLEVGAGEHVVGAPPSTETRDVELAVRHLREEAHLALEDRRRTRHPLCGEKRRQDAVARGVGEGRSLPHRELAGAGLAHRHVRHGGDALRVDEGGGVEAEQPSRPERRREGAVADVVPSLGADAPGVGQPALDLVGEDRGRDQVAAARARDLRRCQDRGPVVARVGRLLREVGVVEVEVADQDAVHEGRHVGAGAAAVERGRGRLRRDPRRHPLRGTRRLASPGAERTAERVDQPPLGLVDHELRELLEADPDRVVGEPLRERFPHLASRSAAQFGR